ncbi:MAG TPA: preprotein translocase subunit SecE [Candidatus Binataceae bacterium]|nr:preprotein translocase subunit SecE [Candidatus Binataceae bacterium]
MASLKSYLEQGVTFAQESWTELSKVHFPSPRETFQATLVVVGLALVVALWLGLADTLSTHAVRWLLG